MAGLRGRARCAAVALIVLTALPVVSTAMFPEAAFARTDGPSVAKRRPPVGRPGRPARPARPQAPKARSAAAARAVTYALAQTGKRYTQAPGHRTGDFNDGFDCSGLVWRAYLQSGIWLGGALRYTQSIIADPQLVEIPWYQTLPGDIIFMTMPGGIRNGHVVLSLGNNRIVEASSVAGQVHSTTIDAKVAAGAKNLRFFRVATR